MISPCWCIVVFLDLKSFMELWFMLLLNPWKGKAKRVVIWKFFHPFSLFLALILFIFVPKCNCKVNILQHTVDDVKMPKTNCLHTTYISENNISNVLSFMISILKSKWWQKVVPLKKIKSYKPIQSVCSRVLEIPDFWLNLPCQLAGTTFYHFF